MVGSGVGGTHGAVEVTPNSSWTIAGGILLDPAATTWNASGSLALNGVISGGGPLIMTGATGAFTFSGSTGNTYSGDTVLAQGNLYLSKPNAVTAIPANIDIGAPDGSSSAAVHNLNSYQIAGNIEVNSGSLYDINGLQENTDYLTLNGNATIKTLGGYLSLKTGAGVTVNPGVNTTAVVNGNLALDPGNHVFTINSGPTQSTIHDLVVNALISQTSTAASIQKVGTGRMRLTGANSYTGNTIVTAGTLQVDGSQTQSLTQVGGSGILQGTGTVGTINFLGSAGIVAPGPGGPGILNSGNFSTGGGIGVHGNLQIELNGTDPGTYDQLNVLGSVGLFQMRLNVLAYFKAPLDNQFTIIQNDGSDPVSSTFLGLPQGSTFSAGTQIFQITYSGGTGNDVLLTKIGDLPPPVLSMQYLRPASVVLAWPTNYPTFRLVSTTNLATPNWNTVSPGQTVIGANYVVTNATIDAQQFYRLAYP
jgi:autotransporter-associated beta strand protein